MRFRLYFMAISVAIFAGTAAQATQATRKYGDVAAPTYGEVAAPNYGEVPAPKYGEVPAPKYGEVPTPGYGESKPLEGDDAGAPDGKVPAPTERTAVPPPFPGERASGAIAASYYYMDRGILHTWDFAADGTYLYTEATRGAGFSRRTSERGTYLISGNTLEVHPTRQTGATASGTTGGNVNTLTAGTDSKREARRYRVKLIGPAGKEGMVLDGVRMKAKTW